MAGVGERGKRGKTLNGRQRLDDYSYPGLETIVHRTKRGLVFPVPVLVRDWFVAWMAEEVAFLELLQDHQVEGVLEFEGVDVERPGVHRPSQLLEVSLVERPKDGNPSLVTLCRTLIVYRVRVSPRRWERTRR